VDIIYFAGAAQSTDAGIACSENLVHFFSRQLASATTTQYSVRHGLAPENSKFPSSLSPGKSRIHRPVGDPKESAAKIRIAMSRRNFNRRKKIHYFR